MKRLRNAVGSMTAGAILALSLPAALPDGPERAQAAQAGEAKVVKASLAPAKSAHETDFSIRFGAVTVGTVTFGVTMEGNHYLFTGNGRTEGLADWFARGKAVIRSTGTVKASQHEAESHYLSVADNKETSTLKMTFEGGEVKDVEVRPDKRKKKKPKRHVMMKPGDLKNIMDPASTMVVPVALDRAKDPEAVCGHTFRVYDGDTRFDIRLSYKRNAKVSTKGYDGYAYVCQMRYVPVSGHEKKHKNTQRMAKNKDMEIWLAPIDGGSSDQAIFTAIRIEVPTWLGTFSAEPDYFGPARS